MARSCRPALNRRGAQLAREARDVSGREAWVAGLDRAAGRADSRAAAPARCRGPGRRPRTGRRPPRGRRRPVHLRDVLAAAAPPRSRSRRRAEPPTSRSSRSSPSAKSSSCPTAPRRAVAAAALVSAGADVVGVNCGGGPEACAEALEAMATAPASDGACHVRSCRMPVCRSGSRASSSTPPARPTWAGSCRASSPPAPRSWVAAAGPRRSTSRRCAGALDALGATARIDAPRAAPRHRARRHRASGRAGRIRAATVPAGADRRAAATNRAGAGARGARYVISVEIDPPRSVRIERTIEAARLLQAAGVDFVNVSDSAMARVRMGALAVAFGIQHDLDLECIVHVTTRDRNLMALESELLGAHALGVRDILALTGDPPRVGDYPAGTGVWDVDSIGLVEILARLNRGEDAAGSPIGQAGRVHDRLRPGPDGGGRRDRVGPPRAQAGGRRPPDHDPAALRPRPGRGDAHARPTGGSGRPGSRCPLLLGVLPLQSSRHAEFLHNEVPGITIPDAVRVALRDAGDRGAEVGLEMTLDAARRGRRARRGDLHHAELRTIRAGRRAGSPAAGARQGVARMTARRRQPARRVVHSRGC